MITTYPDNSLANVVLVGIVLSTAAVAFLVTLRWKWKALPLAALSGVAVPVAVPIIVAVVLYEIDVRGGEWGGFMFHANSLIFLLGLPSALIGFGGGAYWCVNAIEGRINEPVADSDGLRQSFLNDAVGMQAGRPAHPLADCFGVVLRHTSPRPCGCISQRCLYQRVLR